MHPDRPRRCALHVDAHAPENVLSNAVTLASLVHQIAKDTGMRILSVQSSHIDEDLIHPDRSPHEAGISVQALISTSHIAIHTWPHHGYFMFDLVSCKEFDEQKVLGRLEACLGMRAIQVLYRGKEESRVAA